MLDNFRECFADDMEQAYFDLDEFASVHNVDGKDCSVVLTEYSTADAKMSYGLMKATLNPKETAINKTTHLLYIRESDLDRKVTVNAMITLDGKKLFVQSVQNTEGVLRLEVGTHAV
jgi:hypothetical protein